MSHKIVRIIDILDTQNDICRCAVWHHLGFQEITLPLVHARMGNVVELVDGVYHRTLHHADQKKNGANSEVRRLSQPDKNGKSRAEILTARHIIKRAVRDYLHAQNFIEIDMPLRVRGTTPDPHIESFDLGDGTYLTTSTEYHLRRLEVGGFDKIYSLTQNFRKGDTGRYRNPEFTMLEWDRVGASLEDIENDLENFTRAAATALGLGDIISYQEHTIDIKSPWTRMTVREAIQKYTGFTLQNFDHGSLQNAVTRLGLKHNDPGPDAEFLFTLLIDHVQKFLGFEQPVFLREWPLFQTSTAGGDAQKGFANRSECIMCGVELSNGFEALTDATLQRDSFHAMLDYRTKTKKNIVSLDETYLNALYEGLPNESAMALGFDRLVMILTDQDHIRNVMAFYDDEL
jgi:elongation factor P--beta-lysine ligase